VDKGIDYAWQHPAPSAIAAAGYRFAIRYLSNDPSKNITRQEAEGLCAQGIYIVLNWEFTAQDMLRGYSGGVADGRFALVLANSVGMPAGRPIYFSADWDVTPAQESAVIAYLHGAEAALNGDPAGIYGGFYPVKTALDMGAAKWAWQTEAWSGGQWDPRDKIRQTGQAVIGGVVVDTNEAMAADYGQWTLNQNTEVPLMQDLFLSVPPAPDGSEVGIWLRTSDGQYGHITDPADLVELRRLNPSIPTGNISYAQHEVFVAMATKASVTVDTATLASAIAPKISLPLTVTLAGTAQAAPVAA
jgi:hypothetical protein